jgi:inhibitor of cysteine peptidase
VIIALAGLLTPLLSGCAPSDGRGTSATKPIADTVVLTETDADQSVKVSPGQTLEVVLDANPSTGYTWSVAAEPEFLTAQGEPVFSSEAASGLVGAPGTQTLRFTVSAAGEGPLSLSYVRPWEADAAPAQTFTVEITSE